MKCTNDWKNHRTNKNDAKNGQKKFDYRYIRCCCRCDCHCHHVTWATLSSAQCTHRHTQTMPYHQICFCRMEYETGGYKNLSYMLPPSNQWSRFEARIHKHKCVYVCVCVRVHVKQASKRMIDSNSQIHKDSRAHTIAEKDREERKKIRAPTVAIYIQQYNFHVSVFGRLSLNNLCALTPSM